MLQSLPTCSTGLESAAVAAGIEMSEEDPVAGLGTDTWTEAVAMGTEIASDEGAFTTT